LYDCLYLDDISTIPSSSPAVQLRIESFRMQKCDTSVKRPKNAHIFNRLNNCKRIPFLSLFDTVDDFMDTSSDTSEPMNGKVEKYNSPQNQSFLQELHAQQNEFVQVQINGEVFLMNKSQQGLIDILLNPLTKAIPIHGKHFDVFHTKSDNCCLFHALVLVAAHFPNLSPRLYRNSTQMRKSICDFMENFVQSNDVWFMHFMALFTDNIKTKSARVKYVQDMRKLDTWGTRIEIMMFCLMYKCNVSVAHTAEDNCWNLDSSHDAILLSNQDDKHKHNIEIMVNRQGFIASVQGSKPFALGIQANRNHYVFLRDPKDSLNHLNSFPVQDTQSILSRLQSDMAFEAQLSVRDEFTIVHKRCSDINAEKRNLIVNTDSSDGESVDIDLTILPKCKKRKRKFTLKEKKERRREQKRLSAQRIRNTKKGREAHRISNRKSDKAIRSTPKGREVHRESSRKSVKAIRSTPKGREAQRISNRKSDKTIRSTTKGREAHRESSRKSVKTTRSTTKGRELKIKANIKSKRKKRETQSGREDENEKRDGLRGDNKAELRAEHSDPDHDESLSHIWEKFVQEGKCNPGYDGMEYEYDCMEDESDNAVHEQKAPPRNQLHQKYYVKAEMKAFQEDINSWNLELVKPCRCCSRYWFHKGPTKEDKPKCKECYGHPEYLL